MIISADCNTDWVFSSPEAQYAKSLKKTLVPLRYQKFSPSGWLGLMVNPLLYYNVETSFELRSNLPRILEAVERGVRGYREKGKSTNYKMFVSL